MKKEEMSIKQLSKFFGIKFDREKINKKFLSVIGKTDNIDRYVLDIILDEYMDNNQKTKELNNPNAEIIKYYEI